ncbi:MAG: hypothetical protein K9I94_10085 [Bacteroidales bacterium]|nr:hypothetical protein [Bacteroidales bacterium]
MAEKTIFFHVGLGKTGSTYLQYRFFPFLKGIKYIQRTQYRKYQQIIARSEADKVLVSNEFDRQLERELKKMHEFDPTARIIIILRRHDSWMASQYRRQVKNGRALDFDRFLDFENDSGFWKIDEVYFYPKLQAIEKYFYHKPLVLIHDDLKKDPFAFFDRISKYLGVTYNKEDIELNPKHKSYSEKQLKIIRKFGKKYFRQQVKPSEKFYIRQLQRYYKMLFRYLVLYTAALMPKSWAGEDPLIPEEQLERVRKFYEKDWEQCLEYANSIN